MIRVVSFGDEGTVTGAERCHHLRFAPSEAVSVAGAAAADNPRTRTTKTLKPSCHFLILSINDETNFDLFDEFQSNGRSDYIYMYVRDGTKIAFCQRFVWGCPVRGINLRGKLRFHWYLLYGNVVIGCGYLSFMLGHNIGI